MIVDNAEIQAYAEGQPDEAYEVVIDERGQVVIPITYKHVELAFQWFKKNWRPGVEFDFQKLIPLTKCIPGHETRDFTADGIAEGQKLNAGQIKSMFDIWKAEYDKRFSGEAP